jgi:pSer/pThr/pTyr-binding forkhead associated (FHA) protein
MYVLVVKDEKGNFKEVPFLRDEITIGRKKGNAVRLTEQNISRWHARLLQKDGEFFIEDLNSYNGTRVNGSKVSKIARVQENDEIQIGDYKLWIRKKVKREAKIKQLGLTRKEKRSPKTSKHWLPIVLIIGGGIIGILLLSYILTSLLKSPQHKVEIQGAVSSVKNP